MTEPLAILDPELARRLRALTWRARGAVDGLFVGAHKSPHHGASIEFAEHKEYAPGDDLRHLDWKVLGRLDRYAIKKYENETNLKTVLILDASASMGYGEGAPNKLAYARVLAAALAYLTLGQQDAAALAVVDRELRDYLPPRSAAGTFRELGASLLNAEAKNKTDLVRTLDILAERLSARHRLVLISDCLDEEEALLKRLALLAARRHEVAVLHVLHRDELELPFDFLTEFVDMETGEHLLAEPESLRADYRRRLQAFCERMKQGCAAQGILYQSALSDVDPLTPILGLLNPAQARA